MYPNNVPKAAAGGGLAYTGLNFSPTLAVLAAVVLVLIGLLLIRSVGTRKRQNF